MFESGKKLFIMEIGDKVIFMVEFGIDNKIVFIEFDGNFVMIVVGDVYVGGNDDSVVFYSKFEEYINIVLIVVIVFGLSGFVVFVFYMGVVGFVVNFFMVKFKG